MGSLGASSPPARGRGAVAVFESRKEQKREDRRYRYLCLIMSRECASGGREAEGDAVLRAQNPAEIVQHYALSNLIVTQSKFQRFCVFCDFVNSRLCKHKRVIFSMLSDRNKYKILDLHLCIAHTVLSGRCQMFESQSIHF